MKFTSKQDPITKRSGPLLQTDIPLRFSHASASTLLTEARRMCGADVVVIGFPFNEIHGSYVVDDMGFSLAIYT